MADIIGEKRISGAKQNLLKQLHIEKNYFTMASIIEALGKIGDSDCLKIILEWVKENDRKIISEHQYFILKHIFKAIVLLDNTESQTYVFDFKEKYGKYMTDYIVN